jgi:hypothetical protein
MTAAGELRRCIEEVDGYSECIFTADYPGCNPEEGIRKRGVVCVRIREGANVLHPGAEG